jgi:hypothetical protein
MSFLNSNNSEFLTKIGKTANDIDWPSLKSLYPESNIYFFTNPQYFELLLDNPNVHKCLAYDSSCDNLFLMEGVGDHNGFFEIAFLPSVTTQKHV